MLMIFIKGETFIVSSLASFAYYSIKSISIRYFLRITASLSDSSERPYPFLYLSHPLITASYPKSVRET